MIQIKYIKNIIKILLVVILILLPNLTYANTYINNSVEIEVNSQKRNYDYGDNVLIDINIKNKNRYGKLIFKILDIYSGGGFNPLNLNNNEHIIESFENNQISIELIDKYYKKVKKEKSGRHAYGLTEKEYSEFTKYRSEKLTSEKIGNNSTEIIESEKLEQIKTKTNATLFIIFIILLMMVIIIIFVWFIIKSKSGGGFNYISIVLFIGISLLLNVINSNYKIYAADIYQENIKYERTIQTQVNYANLVCTFDVKIEYYFVNTINPITDLELDTDNDTLPDYLEVMYLTDFNNEDTDGDGLIDGVEIYRTYTDPLRVDTDNNGVKDSDEDYDNDGLINIEEKNYGTDYENMDTDFDNLSDFDEINGVKIKNGLKIYQTDPLSEDTDGDGLRDDVELKLNLNPLNKDDANTKVEQKSDILSIPRELGIDSSIPILFYGNLVGDIDENVKVKISNDNYFDNKESLVGNPITLITNYSYNDGLKIELDITKYENIKERLQFCRYENGELIPVENTYIVDNKLLGDVYSGDYVLIDSKKYIEDLKIYIK